MKQWVERLANAAAVTKRVPVNACVHFCGYRYGLSMPNPYEEYAIGLAAGRDVRQVRYDFMEYIRRYRPRDIGEAFGIKLSRRVPLWQLPWRDPRRALSEPGWVKNPHSIVDVMSFFAAGGVSQAALDREFAWHENAFLAISREGYQPEKYSYIRVREFCRGDESIFLILDGNHRLSVLSALGEPSVAVKQAPATRVLRSRASSWPLVKAGLVCTADAIAIFDAFFSGVVRPFQADHPASVL